LARAGDYYEGEFSSLPNPWGPGSLNEQLSCRQSYAILTTDGYWNGDGPDLGNVDDEPGEEVELPDGSSRNTYTAADPFRDTRSNTLADVAMHYWKRDLQPYLVNNVPGSTRNPAVWQHMSTFGISIGLGGTVDQTSVAEVMAEQGVTINGVPSSWPNPISSSGPARIDDLLHAAVNGRGEFVAASNPQEFADALKNSLAVIASRRAAGASVAANGPSLSSDSLLFQATYRAGEWSGDVEAIRITGWPPGDDAPYWSMAQVAMENRAEFRQRNIWTTNAGGNGASFPTEAQVLALARGEEGSPGYVSGEDNANYIKGSAANEGLGNHQLRRRASPFGTIVNSSPFYMDENETLFVGANDGMLHAVDTTDGSVTFSYVPAGLNFTELAKLSSQDYQHAFFVDGGIDVTTKAQSGNLNSNILAASLGRGGKGVFGLDVTDPTGSASQIVKWDHTFQGGGANSEQRNTGYVLGAPLVRRGNNNKLLAIYGNGPYSETGSATLFIRDAVSGAVIRQIIVDDSGGNGLSEVRAADLDGNGTADVLYAGDLKGNVWKFDISDKNNTSQWRAAAVSGNTASPLFRATDPSGNSQPITGGVALAREPSSGNIFVVFGTGSYMIPGDLESTQVQTIYAVIDDSAKNRVRNLDRDDLEPRMIMRSGVDELGRAARSWEPYSELESEHGWYVDLDEPTAGERVVTAPVVRGRALWFASIIPEFGGGCEVGGTGYLNAVDVFTGTNPGRADGSTYSFIDVNRDGEGDDYLAGSNSGDEGLVTSVDVGIGMPSQPTFVGDDAYAAGSDAKLGRLPGLPVGKRPARLRWHELVGDE
jgi:type IV pilus assembly protein PilY1